MIHTQAGQNPLGYQPISKLLLKYAIPSIVSMLTSAFYNIVDQIFIGWGVGFLGNTATTVAFPLFTVGLAIALLVGNGSAAFISLELGKGRTDQAKRTLGNAVTVVLIASVIYAALVLAFLNPILRLLGATDTVMGFAADYASVIMIGMPFNMMGITATHMIRADGSPRFAMAAALTGGLLNIALDPLFIFVFNMGVRGAAIATVISQFVSWVMVVYYFLFRAKFIRFECANLRPHWNIIAKVAALGSSSFITQFAITVLNIVINNSLRHWGGMSEYGSDIPLAAMGIVLKINSILISAILGVAIGAQPILGFNYGAGNYARVKKTYTTVIRITFTLSAVCWLAFLLTPETFISAFGDSNADFNKFAAICMRIFLSGVVFAGIQIPSSSYFQAVGKPLKAMTLTLARQFLFLIPLILILPLAFGLNGILYAGPLGDIGAFAVTLIFISREMRCLNEGAAAMSAGETHAG